MAEPRKVYTGLLPSGAENVFVSEGAADPVAIMLREAGAKLDAERAAEERVRLAKIADEARAKNTRRARAMRRLGKALKFLRG
jgi:hypothetical protein